MNPIVTPVVSWLPIQAFKACDMAEFFTRQTTQPILNPALAVAVSPTPGDGGDNDSNAIVYLLIAFAVVAAVIYLKREKDSVHDELDSLGESLNKLNHNQHASEGVDSQFQNPIKTL